MNVPEDYTAATVIRVVLTLSAAIPADVMRVLKDTIAMVSLVNNSI